ncbi:hypothetical protein SETIT_1G010200v2 [Setaria italica]|uniref:Expansin-like CBD domain-containing protein n=1 Tax=Setaria italica TaxID=4555 RepID=A0A368PGF2_SETIT|nr:hypothetical protein SETIT_1G010200v2 [Setaria italica]
MDSAPVLAAVVLALVWALPVAEDGAATNATSPAPTAGWLKAHATFYGGADASNTMARSRGGARPSSSPGGQIDEPPPHQAPSPIESTSVALARAGSSRGGTVAGLTAWAGAERVEVRSSRHVLARAHVAVAGAGEGEFGRGSTMLRASAGVGDPSWCGDGVRGAAHSGWKFPLSGSWGFLGEQRNLDGYIRVPCVKRGGVRFTIYGHDYFNLVLVTNVAGAGSIRSMDVRSSDSTEWMPMARNWGANWHTLAYLSGKMLSFRVINTDGKTLKSPQTWCHAAGRSA